MMLNNCIMFGDPTGTSFVYLIVICTGSPFSLVRFSTVSTSGRRIGRNSIIPSKAWTEPIKSFWLFKRPTRTLLESCTGWKLTLYWYTPKFVLVLSLKWFVSKVTCPPDKPFLSEIWAGFVATSQSGSSLNRRRSCDGLCSPTLIRAMAWVGGAGAGFCSCVTGGLCGTAAGAWAACAGGGPRDLPLPPGGACSCCDTSPGLRAWSPPRPRPRLLPLARPVIFLCC